MKSRLIFLGAAAVLLTAAVCANATSTVPRKPGTPLFIPGQTTVPPLIEGTSETDPLGERASATLNPPVQSGYVVLVDAEVDVREFNPQKWSDVIVFRSASHNPIRQDGDPADIMILCSDFAPPGTQENGITDQDLAAAGVTIADVLNGNTVWRTESTDPSGLNLYQPDPNNPLQYSFYSDARLIPRAPCPGSLMQPGTAFTLPIEEGPEDPNGENPPSRPIPAPVVTGFLVLLDGPQPDSLNPHTWSDVVIFRLDPLTNQFTITLASDPPPDATGHEQGFTDADLPFGLTIGEILNGNTCYQKEGTLATGLNIYQPDPYATYYIYSDSEIITKSKPKTWGGLKKTYSDK